MIRIINGYEEKTDQFQLNIWQASYAFTYLMAQPVSCSLIIALYVFVEELRPKSSRNFIFFQPSDFRVGPSVKAFGAELFLCCPCQVGNPQRSFVFRHAMLWSLNTKNALRGFTISLGWLYNLVRRRLSQVLTAFIRSISTTRYFLSSER